MTFPRDSYTPFGYLANPFHRARSWTEVEAGLVRTTDDFVGLGWVEPTARRPTVEASILLMLDWNERHYQTRSDFNRLGLACSHHTSMLFSYDWLMDAARGSLSFALADRDALVGELRLTNPGALPSTVQAQLVVLVRSLAQPLKLAARDGDWEIREARTDRRWRFGTSGGEGVPIDDHALAALAPEIGSRDGLAAGFSFDVNLEPGGQLAIGFRLGREPSATASPPIVAGLAAELCARRRREDDAFYAGVARPVGDWPDSWKRGWIYDLETTRAGIFPPGGIFTSEWPSWMISWPRVVVAEGLLDATRFSYADPTRALGLVRTIFADAQAPNVPCVFQGGEPNMVAKDGTVCGTSPAWCLPFHNVWLLYCRTLDRAWLAQILPPLEAYVEYWLDQRTDEEGWIVYKCTWEAGEDCTPRLDPRAEGDEVISQWVRPVELQATLAESATVLARFWGELGRSDRAARWQRVAQDYVWRTRQLWDDAAGRYRDWDKRTGGFLASPGAINYWKTDPVRYSALSLTPIVARIPAPEQLARLASEIERYDVAPWCLWPSWSFVIAEAASTAGWHEFAGRFARRIVDRVYRSNDRRSLSDAGRPTPGTAPEFWPLDLAEFNGSDGYGWGATTSSLWLRQIFGFLDADPSPDVDFVLAPSLPPDLLRPGKRFGFTNVPYRGARLSVVYEVTDGGLAGHIAADRIVDPRVTGPNETPVPFEVDANGRGFRFPVEQFSAYRVSVGPIGD